MATEIRLTEENIDALKALAARGEREPPLVFVGRKDILDDIEPQVRRTRAEGKTLANARIIQGPPGSGKTSFLNECHERYGKNTDVVIPIRLSGEHLNNPADVATAFVESCGFGEQVLGEAHQSEVSGHAGIRWIGLKGSYGSSRMSPLDRIAQGISVFRLVGDYIDATENATFLVLVDETQRIVKDQGQSVNRLGVALADGTTGKLRIMTVFAGLSDTGAALAKAGVSPRLTQDGTHQLGALDEESVQELLSAFFGDPNFGLQELESEQKSEIAAAIVTASECYPRHLHGYVRALALECANNRGRIDIDSLLEQGHEMRIRYYDDLLRFAGVNNYMDAVSRVVRRKAAHEGFTLQEIDKIAKDECGMSSEETTTAHEKAVHGGLLEEDTTRPILECGVRMPIPSFRSYAATGFDRALTLKQMREGRHTGI